VERTVDFPGIAAISTGLATLVLALVEGNRWGWGSPEIVSLLATSMVGFAAFAIVETRSKTPMVDFRFFRSRTFLGANAIAFIVSFAMLAVFFFMALYMQNVLGYGPLDAGLRFLPTTVLIIVTAPIAGRLADRIGPRPLLATGLSLVAVALFLQSQIDVHSGYADLLVPFMIMGFGIALTMSPMSMAAMNSVDAAKAGVASGILSMSRMVGGTFGVAAIGALFQSVARHKLDDALAGTAVPSGARERIVDNLGSGGQHLGDPQVAAAAKEAFVGALSSAMKLSTAVAAAGAVIAVVLIESKLPQRANALEATPEPAG
jgi:predicted MFS family arabinose efflux permease